jgi:conjugal transfer pilus assembly protein TraW
MKKGLSVALLLLSTGAYSLNLGVVGQVFPVDEVSFLTLIEQRLHTLSQSGDVDRLNAHWQEEVRRHANRPTPCLLPKAQRTRKHYYYPETEVSFDIKDSVGRVIYPRGTRVNALTNLPQYRPCWLFINADELSELRWASKRFSSCSNPKIILTGGAVSEAERFLKAPIYFDQGAKITKQLSIKATPARVTRKELALEIEEVAIKESGDVR